MKALFKHQSFAQPLCAAFALSLALCLSFASFAQSGTSEMLRPGLHLFSGQIEWFDGYSVSATLITQYSGSSLPNCVSVGPSLPLRRYAAGTKLLFAGECVNDTMYGLDIVALPIVGDSLRVDGRSFLLPAFAQALADFQKIGCQPVEEEGSVDCGVSRLAGLPETQALLDKSEVHRIVYELYGTAVPKAEARVPSRRVQTAQYAISATRSNTLFIGIDNPLRVAMPGKKTQNLFISAGDAETFQKDGELIVRPQKPGKLTIWFFRDSAMKDAVARQEFRVRRIPYPELQIAGMPHYEYSMGLPRELPRGLLRQAERLQAISSYEFTAEYQISSYSACLELPGKRFFFFDGTGPELTPDLKEKLKDLPAGSILSFYNVRAVLPTSILQYQMQAWVKVY